jgi:hypothetical protein
VVKIVLPEETEKPREVPQSTTSNNSNNSGGSRASVLIAASAVYSPNAIAIYSSNPADTNYYSASGQGFTASATAYVTSAMFRMISQTNVSLNATFEARIYAASGSLPYLPTGSPLAISAPVTWNEILAMTNSGNLEIPFTFDGTFQVQQGTNYFVCVVATSGALNTTNYMWTYYSNVETALNSVRFRNNVWANNNNVDLYFSVIGSTNSGGGGCACDWNNVPFIHLKGNMYLNAVATAPSDTMQFIEIRSNPFDLVNWLTIIQFMRQEAGGPWNFNTPNSAALKFASNIPGLGGQALTVSLFQVNFDTDITQPNTGIACSHHFVVRKDLFINGMLNSIEGAIVLHAGQYRQWLGSYQNPTIYSSEDGYHTVDFREFLSPSPFIPIRAKGLYAEWLEKLPNTSGIQLKSTLLDGTGSSGTSGQVLTSTGGAAPTWQTPSGGAGGVQKGTDTTNATTGQITVSLPTPLPSGTLPIVTCTPIDSTGRTISLVITNRTNTNFTVRASIADSVNHQHKIGHVYATVTNPISIATENNHAHTYSAYTDYQDVNHNHSIASVGDHTHGITHSNSTMNTGPATAGTSHTHTYVEYFVSNNVTNNGGSHTHGNGNTGSTSTNHRHSVAGTTGITSHTHTFSQMPTYMRETVLRLQNGTPQSIGSTMTMYQNAATSTDLYTENAGGGSGSSLGTPVGVTFCWIAV